MCFTKQSHCELLSLWLEWIFNRIFCRNNKIFKFGNVFYVREDSNKWTERSVWGWKKCKFIIYMTSNLRLTRYGLQKCALSKILLKGGQCLLDYINSPYK